MLGTVWTELRNTGNTRIVKKMRNVRVYPKRILDKQVYPYKTMGYQRA